MKEEVSKPHFYYEDFPLVHQLFRTQLFASRLLYLRVPIEVIPIFVHNAY